MNRILPLAIILGISLASCKTSILAERPDVSAIEIPRMPQPATHFDVPISVDLKKYFLQAESSVPNEFSDKQSPCEGLRYTYKFKRSPFNIKGSGNKVTFAFQGQYMIDLTYCATCVMDNCVVPKVTASCGLGEPLRKINIGYTAAVKVLPNYKLSSKTDLTQLEPVDRCKVSVLNIDATDRLVGYIRQPLKDLGGEVDKRVGEVDFKKDVDALWKQLSTELKIGEFGYLYVNPKQISLSEINMNGSVLNFSVGLTANPLVSASPKTVTSTALPNLSSYTKKEGFNIYLDLVAEYDTLTRHLNNALTGQVFEVGKKKITVTAASVSGIGSNKMALKLSFTGSKKGTVYLVGTPHYDAETHVISFPDLNFDVKSKSLLLNTAEWMFNDKITKTLREKAQYDLSEMLESSKARLQTELNRKLDGGISLNGQITDLNIMEIFPEQQHLMLRAITVGKLNVEMLD